MPRAFGTALRAENYSLCESRTPISEAALVVAHDQVSLCETAVTFPDLSGQPEVYKQYLVQRINMM